NAARAHLAARSRLVRTQRRDGRGSRPRPGTCGAGGRMRRRLRVDPLYVLAGVLVLVVLGLAIFVGTNARSQVRSGSALDNTSGGWSPVMRSQGRTLAAMTREGTGTLIVVGSLAPFVNQFLPVADNGRFALSLAAAGFGSGRSIGFDEYHHGAHPSAELMAVLERTWLGRAMLLAGALVFVYLWWSGRRFGAPLPADPRPPRSSLEYIHGFAGLL